MGLRVSGVDRPVKLSEARTTLPLVTLTTNPPAYHGQVKRYRGVDLGDLLREEGAKLERDTTLTFVCNDGYRSQIPAALLAKHRAVLAWAEVNAAGKEVPFELVKLASGKRLDPGPLYVVWETISVKDTYPAGWPFGVLRIEVTEGSAASPIDPDRMAPAEAGASVRDGFAIWSRVCFACHSLNGIGGRIGPELNRPINVTTYFDRPILERYIRDWQSVREPHGNEKMPRLTDLLTAAEVTSVVDYLAWMNGRKSRPAR